MIVSTFTHMIIFLVAGAVVSLEVEAEGEMLNRLIPIWILMVPFSILVVLLFYLILLHIYLNCRGISTYVYIMERRKKNGEKQETEKKNT